MFERAKHKALDSWVVAALVISPALPNPLDQGELFSTVLANSHSALFGKEQSEFFCSYAPLGCLTDKTCNQEWPTLLSATSSEMEKGSFSAFMIPGPGLLPATDGRVQGDTRASLPHPGYYSANK